jgi:hypothetical protein
MVVFSGDGGGGLSKFNAIGGEFSKDRFQQLDLEPLPPRAHHDHGMQTASFCGLKSQRVSSTA